MKKKIELIRNYLKKNKVDSCILSSKQGRYWLSNFQASYGFIVITKKEATYFLDGRYYQKGLKEIDKTKINVELLKSKETLIDYFYSNSITTAFLEEEYTTLEELSFFQDILDEIKPIKSKELRIIKNKNEIDNLRHAAKKICEVMEWIKKEIKEGMTEKEVANLISCRIIQTGGECNSFDPIVASGPNGAFPHHSPTDRLIRNGDFVTIDIGCKYMGYCSDLTRTFPIGKPNSDELIRAYDVVLKSNKTGIKKAKAGITGQKLDKYCRDIISGTEFKDYFTHSTGHGVGIDVHELPIVSQNYKEKFHTNSIVTIEPGIYIPNVGGIRIEDMILITEDGCEVLTESITKKREW
ncbi:MAG: M24 family metallopeptidase [Mycoplasmoidaceae bacterium]